MRNITIVGYISNNVELKDIDIKNGERKGEKLKACFFSVADSINRINKTTGEFENQETFFIDCAFYGNKAENIYKYLQKGKQVAIGGILKYNAWEQKIQNEIIKRSKHYLLVKNLQIISKRNDQNSNDDEVNVEGIDINQDIQNKIEENHHITGEV